MEPLQLWQDPWGPVPSAGLQCAAKAVNSPNCTSPLTIVYESGGDRNCYCATSTCTDTDAQWQKRYTRTETTYSSLGNKVCTSPDAMYWLANGDGSTLEGCKAMAELNGACAQPKTIAFESGNHHNCYCAQTSTCDAVDTDWLSMYVLKGADNATSLEPTSTGALLKQLTSVASIAV